MSEQGWDYLRPEVQRFATLMEEQLRQHDDRPGWEHCSVRWLFARMEEEAEEVKDALRDYEPADDIAAECADVANFMMMIADVCQSRERARKAVQR